MNTKHWKKIDEKIVFDEYRKIKRKTFILPNGKKDVFDIVDYPNVAIILGLTKNNTVIVARQFRPGTEEFFDELPGGAIEGEEEASEAARREFLEETGFSGDVEYVGQCRHWAYSTAKKYAFVARNCKKVADPKNDDNEFVEVVEVPLEKFRKHIKKSIMTDMDIAYLCLDHLKILQ